MKICTDICLLYTRQLIETLRNPVFLFMGITIPLIYLGLFSPLLQNFADSTGFPTDNVLDTFVPGMLVMIAFYSGLFSGFGLIDELRSGVIERFRVSPTSRLAILAGPVLRDTTAALCQALVFILFAFPFGFRIDGFGLVIVLVLLSFLVVATSSFGHAVAVLVKSEDRFAPIVQGVNLPILLLSGMLLPISLAPRWLQIIAHCNPVYYIVEAARLLAGGRVMEPMVFYAFLMIIPLTGFLVWWATRVFRKAIM